MQSFLELDAYFIYYDNVLFTSIIICNYLYYNTPNKTLLS